MSGNLREWCKDMYAKDAYSNHGLHNPMYVSENKKENLVVPFVVAVII